MKYVVTGATGFVGKHLVPRLNAGGAELLLIGRDPDKLLKARMARRNSGCIPWWRSLTVRAIVGNSWQT